MIVNHRNLLRVLALLVGCTIPTVNSTSRLILKDGTAQCEGDFDLNLLRVNCGGEMCTYGSIAYISGQIEAAYTLPKMAHVEVRTNVWPTGIHKLYEDTKDVCNSNVLTPPAGDDAGYKCRSAGRYNFETAIRLHGNEYSWYRDLYGFTQGLSISIEDIYNSGNVTDCSVTLQIKKGYETYTVPGNYVFGAGLGIVWVLLGFGLRRRRAARMLAESQRDGTTGSDQDDGPHFEMMTDPTGSNRVIV